MLNTLCVELQGGQKAEECWPVAALQKCPLMFTSPDIAVDQSEGSIVLTRWQGAARQLSCYICCSFCTANCPLSAIQ